MMAGKIIEENAAKLDQVIANAWEILRARPDFEMIRNYRVPTPPGQKTYQDYMRERLQRAKTAQADEKIEA